MPHCILVFHLIRLLYPTWSIFHFFYSVLNYILFLFSVYFPAAVSQFFPTDHVFDSFNLQQPCLSVLFIQKLAVLKDGFQLDSGSQQELWGSSPSLANSELSIPRLYSDASSQTDIPAEVSPVQDVSVDFLSWPQIREAECGAASIRQVSIHRRCQ